MTSSSNSSRNFIPMQNKYDRVILLVDMDCFYCQVEEKLNLELKGQPLAVVQYNAWRGGGIIAVNYAARAKGVTRHMRGDEAREQCPEIQLVKVPNVREKADLSKYREAGRDVANVLQKFTNLLERASVDEAYLDITEAVNKRLDEMNAGTFVLKPQELIDTYAVGYERIGDYLKVITSHFANPYADDELLGRTYDPTDVPAVRQSDVRLLLGASIASEIRAAVKASTTYECSAGIAHNKILAKLACGMNKPNKQTILPLLQVEKLFETLPVGKIKGLGAKFGEEVCEKLKIRFLGQMLKFTESELQKKFDEKNGTWLYYICRGIDLEAVTPRFYSKSIGCCKKFPGRNNITGLNTLKHWLNELATEISERLEKDIMENNRKAKQMTVSYIQEFDGEEISSSRSVALGSYEQEALAAKSLEVIKLNTKQFLRPGSEGMIHNPIKFLGISVGKFETIASGQTKLQEMFANQALKKRKIKTEDEETPTEEGEQEAPEEIQKLEKEKELPSDSKQKEEEKMKGFFAKYLQNQKKGLPNGLSKDPPTDIPNQIKDETQENPKFEKTKAEKIPKEENQGSPVIESFFMNALKRKNPTTQQETETSSASLAEETNEDSVLPEEINSVELDDILKLEAELQQIEKETQGKSCSPRKDKSFPSSVGSPEKKKPKLSPASSSSYQNQYAEFAAPQLRLDLLEFQKCELCGVKIPIEEKALQTHRDHHFAQQLSQQQRDEFRTEIKTKLDESKLASLSPSQTQQKAKTNPSKKQKKGSTDPPVAANITKFLKPVDKTTTTTEASSSATKETEDSITCKECGAIIKKDDLLEHEDFHLAKRLQRELNQLEVHTVAVGPKKSSASSSSNRTLNGTLNKGREQAATVAIKPITQFFTNS